MDNNKLELRAKGELCLKNSHSPFSGKKTKNRVKKYNSEPFKKLFLENIHSFCKRLIGKINK